MKTAKFWMYLLPLLALALAWTPDARAATETVNGVTWQFVVINGEATLINPTVPTGTTGDIVIPSTLGGCPVTVIASGAFVGCSGLTSVTIADSVTNIGNSAFSGCSGLTRVTIGNGVTSIGERAFYDCSGLTGVTIGHGVTSIGKRAFYGCRGLTGVTIGHGVTSIGEGAFTYCNGLLYDTSTIPNVKLVDGWAVGYESAFYGSLDLVGVRGIADGAFSGCGGLTSVTIPNSVTNIGTSAFTGCGNIRSVAVQGQFRLSEVFPASYSAITNAVVADGSTGIAPSAFSGCGGLMRFVVGGNNPSYCSVNGLLLSKDGKSLLYGVNGDVTIPNSVTGIGASAFSGCGNLASVTIPDSVTSIESTAFSGCGNVRSMVIPGRFRLSEVFPDSYSAITNVVVTSGSTSIAPSAFSGCSGLASVTIPDSVISIGASAFADCVNLTSVTIPDSVVDIPQSAFEGCNKYWASMFRSVGGPQTVSLTVTNVVVHFVTQSVPSAAVTPATNATGIVNIIAEITASNAVAIAQDWAAQYPGFEAAYGSDFTAALTMETGKRDGSGRPLRVWQDYVAGTDPTDPASLFAASIVHDAQTGDMIVSCSPELSPAEAAKRRYSVYGKANLTDPGWTLLGTGLPWRASGNSDYHFFRVTVEMR